MTCACGLLAKGVCPGSKAGACPAMGLPCGPITRGALRNRVKRRLLYSFANAHRVSSYEVPEGGYIRPLWSSPDEEALIAEGLRWFRQYILDRRGWSERAKAKCDALILWAKTQNRMVGGTAHSILVERARASGRGVEGVMRDYYRLVNMGIDTIIEGLLEEGREVREAPNAHKLPYKTNWRLELAKESPRLELPSKVLDTPTRA